MGQNNFTAGGTNLQENVKIYAESVSLQRENYMTDEIPGSESIIIFNSLHDYKYDFEF